MTKLFKCNLAGNGSHLLKDHHLLLGKLSKFCQVLVPEGKGGGFKTQLSGLFQYFKGNEKKTALQANSRANLVGENVPVTDVCLTGDKHHTLLCYKNYCFVPQSCFWIPSSRFTMTWDSKGKDQQDCLLKYCLDTKAMKL